MLFFFVQVKLVRNVPALLTPIKPKMWLTMRLSIEAHKAVKL